jgi:hypothetical protein
MVSVIMVVIPFPGVSGAGGKVAASVVLGAGPSGHPELVE